jgi:hypothetical protein
LSTYGGDFGPVPRKDAQGVFGRNASARASTIVFSLTTERNSQECQVKEDRFKKE